MYIEYTWYALVPGTVPGTGTVYIPRAQGVYLTSVTHILPGNQGTVNVLFKDVLYMHHA